MDTYLLLNGPNLNRLGKREPAIYGHTTLQDIEQSLIEQAEQAGARLVAFQSNHEGAIIDRLHEAEDEGISGIIFNPGAFTHYSRAIGDAVAAISVPVVEVHISNIHAREAFRHQSVIAPYAAGQLCGFGIRGYSMALDFFLQKKGEV